MCIRDRVYDVHVLLQSQCTHTSHISEEVQHPANDERERNTRLTNENEMLRRQLAERDQLIEELRSQLHLESSRNARTVHTRLERYFLFFL